MAAPAARRARLHGSPDVIAPRRKLRVAILGAGASGLCAAARLLQSGLADVAVYEKSAGLGGTWRDNSYPGSGCDVPSHLYSFSFARRHDWSLKYAEQPEILDYLEQVADGFGIRPHIRFSTEVTSASWDEVAGLWRLETAHGEHPGELAEAEILIAATGQLNRPFVPSLPGLDNFRGTRFHTARWDHGHDLSGEDVVVIGSGATAIQLVPRIADVARSVTIFQRSSNYVVPKPDRPIGSRERWAFAHVPGYDRAYRWSLYWRLESHWPAFRRDSQFSRFWHRKITKDAAEAVGTGLPEKAWLPDYPIGCKRILLSNDWYSTLLRPNVRIVTSGVREVREDALVTSNGDEVHADALILSTGFRASTFLAGVRVAGRGGASLEAVWQDGAEAYLGLSAPRFPNFFMLYGPNTNLGHNSILFMVEQQVHYVLAVLARAQAEHAGVIEVTPGAMTRYQADVERRLLRTAWAGPCRTWYKGPNGRITQNWPASTPRYWWRLHRPNWPDWSLLPAPDRALSTDAGTPPAVRPSLDAARAARPKTAPPMGRLVR